MKIEFKRLETKHHHTVTVMHDSTALTSSSPVPPFSQYDVDLIKAYPNMSGL